MARLDRSLAEIRMAPPLDRAGWLAAFGKLVHGNGGGDLLLYVQVTRGVEPERNHVPPPATRPTIFAGVQKLPRCRRRPSKTASRRSLPRTSAGRAATSSPRRSSATCCCAGSRRTPARRRRSCFATGMLTEGSASSAHVVKDGRVDHAAADQRDPAGHDARRHPRARRARRHPVGAAARHGERIALGGRAPDRLRGRRHPRDRDARRPARSAAGAPGPGVPEDLCRLQGDAAGILDRAAGLSRHRRAVPVSLRIPDQGDGPRLGVVPHADARDRRAPRGGARRPIASASA